MRRCWPILALGGLLMWGGCTPPEPETVARTPALASHDVGDCPLADPVMEDIPVPTRSSIETPFLRASQKPYEDWTEYDRGVAAKYLDAHFPGLTQDEILAALFTNIPQDHPSEFRQWLQLRGFAAPNLIFLLRNYTTLDIPQVNELVREELHATLGSGRFSEWLTVATHFDRSPELTSYVVGLLIESGHPVTKSGSCRFGAWCHDHLARDLTPAEAARVIREFAVVGSDVVPLFVPVQTIYATDPSGFLKEAALPDMRGVAAAHLLFLSGDLAHLEAFLTDTTVAEDIRAYWAYRLAQDPPPGSGALLQHLRDTIAPGSLVYGALRAEGSVRAPYASCQERVQLLAGTSAVP